ncbi:MAG: N-acetylmuramoyl-L-alanine amidase [Methanococcaceae archaeon]
MKTVIVHCSDSGFGNAVLIDSWHAERGFKTPAGIHVGYHFVILNGQIGAYKHNSMFDGTIETGRPIDDDSDLELDEIGAHTFGYNNAVGICLIGLSGTFSVAQIRSLKFLIKMLRKQFGEIKVIQHSDVDKKKPYCAGLTPMQMKELNIVL